MDKRALNTTVATAVRVERDERTDDLYLVFRVTSESFKQRIINDWMQDIEVKLIGKDLTEEET